MSSFRSRNIFFRLFEALDLRNMLHCKTLYISGQLIFFSFKTFLLAILPTTTDLTVKHTPQTTNKDLRLKACLRNKKQSFESLCRTVPAACDRPLPDIKRAAHKQNFADFLQPCFTVELKYSIYKEMYLCLEASFMQFRSNYRSF